MKRLFTIIQKDLISTTRDALLLYILAAPLIIAVGARIFLPTVGQSSVNMVMTEATAAELGETLGDYANVIEVRDDAALERRVLALDEAVGVAPAGGGYELLLEGNESATSQELAAIALERALSGEPLPQAEVVEVGTQRVPFREWIGAFTALSVLFFGAIVMGFHIIEDKESGMILAMGVSPLTRRTYLLARGVLVLAVGVLGVFISLYGLGITTFDPAHILLAALAGTTTAVLFGFIMGAITANQIAGFAFVKIGFWPIILPAVIALFIPSRWEWTLYWTPTYWVFESFKRILVEGLGWAALWGPLVWTVALTAVFAAVAYPFLKGKLDFAQD